VFVFLFSHFFLKSSFVSFSFSFLEFINGVCGLRWMCCGEIVAFFLCRMYERGKKVVRE